VRAELLAGMKITRESHESHSHCCSSSSVTVPQALHRTVPIVPFHASLLVERRTGVPLCEPVHREYARPGTAQPEFAYVTAEQDFASAAYMLYAATMYDHSTGRFNITWQHMVGTELVAERARVMEEDKFEVWCD
jgi:hypothetical protein